MVSEQTPTTLDRLGRSGFTLIEMLVTLTIIAILTSISLPIYLAHQARSQLTQAMTLGNTHRVNIESYILDSGQFPPNSEQPTLLPLLEEVNGQQRSRYPVVAQVQLIPENQTGAGRIQIVLETDGVAAPIQGREINFTRTENGSWFCFTNVAADLIPRGCYSQDDGR